ncbi:MAG: XdhC family protein [Ardenticatenaceae bacterium]|nr:XdhC family protein [Ardenticatenaceae bacterium]
MASDESYAIMQELMAAQGAGEPLVLATIVKARGSVPRHIGTKMLIYGDGRSSGTIGGGEMEARVRKEAETAMQNGQATSLTYSLVDPERGDPGVCGGEVEIFIEPYLAMATVFIVGCGHVGKAVADLAHWLGYRVVVTDDREELATPTHIPHADIHLPGTIDNALAQYAVTSSTFVVVVTRNVLVDRKILPHLITTPAPYIGVMGSRRRWETTLTMLREDGLSDEDISRLHCPLGLELNAESPEEIAVSIMAEVIMLRRHGHGGRMALGPKMFDGS